MWVKFKQFLKDFFIDEKLISLVVVLFIASSIGFGFLSGLILTIITAVVSAGLFWALRKLVKSEE